MYEKFALNISSYLGYNVEIAGQKSEIPSDKHSIVFHPIFNGGRMSQERIFPSKKYYNLLLKSKPDINIVNTHDLQIVSIIYKIIFGSKLLYDLREDYFRNSLYMGGFQTFKWVVAYWARSKEIICSNYMDGIFLAEKIYSNIPFTKIKSTQVENKYQASSEKIVINKDPFLLSYTGTISLKYGILDAIETATRFYETDKRYRFIIMGYCSNKLELRLINRRIKEKTFISIYKNGTSLVPHSMIDDLINKSKYSLLPYSCNQATFFCLPTKFYECKHYQTEIITNNQKNWYDKLFSITKKNITF